MCGITADIVFNKKELYQSKDIIKMTRTLRHRGPDDEGFLFVNANDKSPCLGAESKVQSHIENKDKDDFGFIEDYEKKSYIALGHRRLSIIDLSVKGHQPLSYLNRYWIVFNGEIYNYIEIREELKSVGYIFNSDSDTEVILAAYDFWGNECLKKFNGMWALIIFDSLEEKLFISRDRFGIKPLSYYIDDERIILASEIKALVDHSNVKTKPNIKYIKDFIKTFTKEYLSETAFENIFHFPASHYLEIDLNRSNNHNLNFIKYWEVNVNTSSDNFVEEKIEQFADEYRQLLDDSVKLRLRSDVPIGTVFSGGLDSSTIVYLINKLLKVSSAKEKQKTFSLVFKIRFPPLIAMNPNLLKKWLRHLIFNPIPSNQQII